MTDPAGRGNDPPGVGNDPAGPGNDASVPAPRLGDRRAGELTTAAVAVIVAVVLTVGGLLPVLRGGGAERAPSAPAPAQVGRSPGPEPVP